MYNADICNAYVMYNADIQHFTLVMRDCYKEVKNGRRILLEWYKYLIVVKICEVKVKQSPVVLF